MYTAHAYARMLTDAKRREAFSAALRGCVRPGSVVVEIGTGIGYFALLCAQLGAARVYAFESSQMAAQLAYGVSRSNGDWPVQIIQSDSRLIQLTERADVLLADLRGGLPVFGSSLACVIDARDRFLKSDGTLVARSDAIFAALVEAPEQYEHTVNVWRRIPGGVDLECARTHEVNNHHRVALTADQLLSEGVRWATVDYATVRDEEVSGRAELECTRTAHCHGVGVWFDCEVAEGVTISNSPQCAPTIYGQVLFPLPEPVVVKKGDCVDVAFVAARSADGYSWSWRIRTPTRRFIQSQGALTLAGV